MPDFSKDWEGAERRVKAVLKPQKPLRQKLESATRRIEAQSLAIEGAINRLKERDRSLFSKIADAYSKRDIQRANVYANELAEIRKMGNFMMSTKLALEKVALRLSTVSQFGNASAVLAPAVKILQSIRPGIANILPGAEQELGAIATLLDEIMIGSGQIDVDFDFETASEDAQKILNEAALVAEQRMKEKFPELPTLKTSEEHAEGSEYRNS